MAYARNFGAAGDRHEEHLRVGLASALAAAKGRPERPAGATRRATEATPEIECIRRLLPPGLVFACTERAVELGVGADEVLIGSGHISEERYYRALALAVGVPFAELDGWPRALCPLSDEALLSAASAGILPLALNGELVWVMAPRGIGARRFASAVGQSPAMRHRVLVSSCERIERFALQHASGEHGRQASDDLFCTHPVLSAKRRTWRFLAMPAAFAAALLAALALAPALTVAAVQIAISAVFLAWIALRAVAAWNAPKPQHEEPALPDHTAPFYTIVVALYREVAALPGLIAALQGLDYPREKLEVMIVLEADDAETRQAVDLMELGPPFRTILAPPEGPRTKPKALNAALPLARGELLVVFDAEDRPEPDQLRRAAAAFAADRTGMLACVQARLTIDNTSDGWLAALFTAEYAGLFDVLLPGLAHLRLPIPLGGSSNHLRTAALRKSGGWDAYNVTEDADLGTRLARMGYAIDVIASTTYEEAPNRFDQWLTQRTRWFKGWMQTWCVHMRHPIRLMHEIGPVGFATFQLMLIGNVFAALLQPVAIGLLVVAWTVGGFSGSGESSFAGPQWVHATILAGGYVASVALGFAGLARRGLWGAAWRLPMMLVHWALLSIAAWRALYQFFHDPHGWEKTEHGLARTSRRKPTTPCSP